MSERVVLITGALTGIGRATARAFANDGARIILSGRRDREGDALAVELSSGGADVAYFRSDVRFEAEVSALVAHAVERHGRLDVAVNCAGTEGAVGPLEERTVDEFSDVFDTNVLGTFLCLKYELRIMKKQRHGSIVTISSTMGQRGSPGASLYVGSKHAVEGLTKSAALEAAPFGVRVNAIAPGPVETELLARFTGTAERMAALAKDVPLGRLGDPAEIAAAILFVSSDAASFVTGQIVGVNGGRTAK
jgi:NAD(P)-dependent dehydrogenase (short-subunit alcohol dehydrogenase family)